MSRSSSVARFPTGVILHRGPLQASYLGTKLHGEIVVAFELAVNNGEYEVAKELLDTFEQMTLRKRVAFSEAERARLVEWLVGAHYRLLEGRQAVLF